MRKISDSDISDDLRRLRAALFELGRRRPLRDPVHAAVEEMQFTPAQVHTFLWLGNEGALTMGEIAARLGITEKTVTGVIDRLEAESCVARVRDTEDRRVVRVRLTAKGTRLYRRFDEHLQAKMAGLLRMLDPAEREALIRILSKLLERIQP